jgi:uncharacterized lipoprotein YddW (UPF0748 family)
VVCSGSPVIGHEPVETRGGSINGLWCDVPDRQKKWSSPLLDLLLAKAVEKGFNTVLNQIVNCGITLFEQVLQEMHSAWNFAEPWFFLIRLDVLQDFSF